jgi:hypothetical protein
MTVRQAQSRVTRLGEFSHTGSLFILGSLSEHYTSSQNFWLLFQGKNCVLILTKTGWATFWPKFSLTHLVTLIQSHANETQSEKNSARTELPDFSCNNIPKRGKNLQNDHKIYQMAMKHKEW